MHTSAFIVAFFLTLCVATSEIIGPDEMEGAFSSSEKKEVTVDVICAWGAEPDQRRFLMDSNSKVAKVTGSIETFRCKDGTKLQALSITDEQHDYLAVRCAKQYREEEAMGVWPLVQPALNKDGAPFLSNSYLVNQLAEYCKQEKVKPSWCTSTKMMFTQRSSIPLLSAYFTPEGEKGQMPPKDC